MTVPADLAKDQVQTATTGLVNLRDNSRWAGGSLMHDVARAVTVSERTLRRLFSTHLGMSWRSYLLRARVLRSTALLAQPDRSVLEVSIAVGFDDPGAFARSFARHCGETPSAYRRRIGVVQDWG
jgi:transcriptional regulator GlxA family with amidase domain